MSEKKIRFVVDDAGIHPAVNNAISSLCNKGLIQVFSIVPSGKYYSEIIDIAKRYQDKVMIGCHLTFIEEDSISEHSEIPSLIDTVTGRFYINYKKFISKLLLGQINVYEIETEIRRQIEKLLNSGLKIDILDSHQHIHVFPVILKSVISMARKYNISKIRVPFDPFKIIIKRYNIRSFLIGIINILSLHAYKEIRKNGIIPQLAAGIIDSGHMNLELLNSYIKILKRLKDNCDIIFHPNTDNKSFNKIYPHWGFNGEREYNLLMNREITSLL